MPPAKFLNNTFLFTPEDLVLSGLVSCLVYLPCCVILAVLVSDFRETTERLEELLRNFFAAKHPEGAHASDEYLSVVNVNSQLLKVCHTLVGMFAANFVINAAMSAASCRGAMLEASKRGAVMPLAVCSILLCIAMMWPLGIITHALALGVHGVYNLSSTLGNFVEAFYKHAAEGGQSLQAVCIFAWLVVTLTPLTLLSLYSVFGGGRHRVRRFMSSCAHLCGCSDAMKSDEAGESAIRDEVDIILRRVFGVLPLVGSDYAAGLMLLARRQKHQRQEDILGSGPSGDTEEPSLEVQWDRICNMLTPPRLPENHDKSVAEPVQMPLRGSERVDTAIIDEAMYYLPWAEMAFGKIKVLKQRKEQSLQSHQIAGSAEKKYATKGQKRKSVSWEDIYGAVFNVRNFILNSNHHTGDFKLPKAKLESALSARRRLIHEQLHVAEEDILDVRMDNQALGCVPYYIALDREKHSIVLAIRGSASLQDALTDFITTAAPILFITKGKGLFDDLEPPIEQVTVSSSGDENLESLKKQVCQQFQAPLSQVFEWSKSKVPWEELEALGGYGHRGIIVAATKLWDDICSQGILAAAAAGRLHGLPELAHWRVLVTGHSLGAGLASLMTWALKPALEGRLFCWAYEPPGGLMSAKVAGSLEDCLISTVHAKDLVPRLTWSSVRRLQNDMMEAVARSKVNKNTILWWSRSWLNPSSNAAILTDALFDEHQLSVPEIASALATFHSEVNLQDLNVGIEHTYTFCLPGKIMYLRPLKGSNVTNKHTKMQGRCYDAVWITRQQLAEDGILIGQRTIADHDFLAVDDALTSSRDRNKKVMTTDHHQSATTNGCEGAR